MADVVRNMYGKEATIGAVRPRGPSKPPHPADGLCADVKVGDGAFMTILDPRSFEDGGLAWRLTYGEAEPIKHTAVSVVDSYDYLLSDEITEKEAARRLTLMRDARRSLALATP